MKKIRLLIGVVLFKEPIGKSNTLLSLIKLAEYLNKVNAKVIIWDNSPEKQSISELERLNFFSNHQYFHTPENMSLAKIYNKMYVFNNSYDILMLFDQDSYVEMDYFIKIQDALEKNPTVNLFLPIIKVEELIASPADRKFVSGKYWNQLRRGLIKAKDKLAITSGMAISIKYLVTHHPCFNEELNLYGIDTDFMIQYEKRNRYFFVIDYVMEHNLSFFENESMDKKIMRFRDHKKSLKIIFKKESELLYFMATISLFLSALKLSIKHRTLIFF